MIIRVKNQLDVQSPNTYLSFNEVSGTNVLRVRNVNLFSPSWAVQVGKTGEQQAEISLLGTGVIGGTSGTLTANTSFAHPADTPVFPIKYDQLVFEVSTTGTTASAIPIASGTVSITPNSLYTQFDHTAGSPSYAYRTFYRNSVTAGTTTESDWITSSGFSTYSLGKMRQRAKDKLVNASYIPDDRVWTDWLNEWFEIMTNAAIDVNEDYSIGTTQIAFSNQTELGTITNTDFKNLKRVWAIDATGTFQATKMDSNSFSPNKTFTITYPYFYMQGDTVMGRKPADSSGTYLLEYYSLGTQMVEDTDTLPVSMWGYTKSFVDYAHAQALFKDQKIDEAGQKLQEATAQLARFKVDISPRNKTGVTYIDIVEDVASDQELWL